MHDDVEVIALQAMYDAIKDQPSDAQSRMLRWLTDRIEWDPRLAVRYWAEQNGLSGHGEEDSLIAAKSLVADIRRNRKNGTEPWKSVPRG